MKRLDAICRWLVLRQLGQLKHGCLELVERTGVYPFGDQQAGSDHTVRLRIVDDRFYRRVVLGGDLGFAESYMSGECESDDLTALLRFFVRNASTTNRLDRGVAWIRRSVSRLGHWMRRNTAANARKNISAHYDLSNEFFALFLDETWNYSSGVFYEEAETMAQASSNKMRMACEKLDLAATDHLLEIGTGWGALAEMAARDFGCQVTTTTISEQQHVFADDRFKRAGLENQISLLKSDYRDLNGGFDKIVSIEMIEAVGHQFFDTFFQKCATLLKPDGKLCMQAIVIADDMYDDYIRNIDFIRAYIFPGGCLPSVAALTESAARSQLQLVQMQDHGASYAETLRRWRWRFDENQSAIRKLGFDDRFMRMWEYYLRYCEAGFAEHQVDLVQLVFEPRERPAERVENVSSRLASKLTDRAVVPRPHMSDRETMSDSAAPSSLVDDR